MRKEKEEEEAKAAAEAAEEEKERLRLEREEAGLDSEKEEELEDAPTEKANEDKEENKEEHEEKPISEKAKTPEPVEDLTIVVHPLHREIEQLQIIIGIFETRKTDQEFNDFIIKDILGMHDYSYRKKIKGFHLAFNVRAKLEKASKYKFVPQDGTAAEIVARNNEKKKKRLEVNALKEKAGQDKFKQERSSFRIHAEQLRKKK